MKRTNFFFFSLHSSGRTDNLFVSTTNFVGNFVFPCGKTARRARKETKAPSFIDVSVSSEFGMSPELAERKRQLLEKLNQINLEQEKIARLRRNREYAQSVRVQAIAASTHNAPTTTTTTTTTTTANNNNINTTTPVVLSRSQSTKPKSVDRNDTETGLLLPELPVSLPYARFIHVELVSGADLRIKLLESKSAFSPCSNRNWSSAPT